MKSKKESSAQPHVSLEPAAEKCLANAVKITGVSRKRFASLMFYRFTGTLIQQLGFSDSHENKLA